jgi:hypothetical protein
MENILMAYVANASASRCPRGLPSSSLPLTPLTTREWHQGDTVVPVAVPLFAKSVVEQRMSPTSC